MGDGITHARFLHMRTKKVWDMQGIFLDAALNRISAKKI